MAQLPSGIGRYAIHKLNGTTVLLDTVTANTWKLVGATTWKPLRINGLGNAGNVGDKLLLSVDVSGGSTDVVNAEVVGLLATIENRGETDLTKVELKVVVNSAHFAPKPLTGGNGTIPKLAAGAQKAFFVQYVVTNPTPGTEIPQTPMKFEVTSAEGLSSSETINFTIAP